jgi:hypothetical protein
LHALSLKIIKPGSGKTLQFETPAPRDFLALMNVTAARIDTTRS